MVQRHPTLTHKKVIVKSKLELQYGVGEHELWEDDHDGHPFHLSDSTRVPMACSSTLWNSKVKRRPSARKYDGKARQNDTEAASILRSVLPRYMLFWVQRV